MFKNIFKEKYKIFIVAFFIIYFLIGVCVVADYGIPWDEAIQRSIGFRNFDYILGNSPELLESTDRYYGPVFETLLVGIEKGIRLDEIRTIFIMRHFTTFLLFYSSVIFFYLLCKERLKSRKISLLACTFLILSPRIFAHSFYNCKDIVFLSMFIIGIYTLVKYLNKPTSPIRAVLHALTCAILIDIRILGILVPFITIVSFSFQAMKNKKEAKKNILSITIYFICLILFVILFFPILWHDTISNFINTIKIFSQYTWNMHILYLGDYIPASELPWHYSIVWIMATTPILYIFLFIIGIISYIKGFLKKQRKYLKYDLIILTWFFLPILLVIFLNSTLYDSWRHIFFVYPAFIIIASMGLKYIYEWIKNRKHHQKILKISLTAIIIIQLLFVSWFMIKSHPYQNVYFNTLTKFSQPVDKNFEMDYWGLSYLQALKYITDNDDSEEIKVNFANEAGLHNILGLESTNRDRIVETDIDNAQYFLTNHRAHQKEEYPYEDKFYTINIDNMEIMTVYKLK